MRMSPMPPLNSLIAFEAAVRHMSFTRAAVELNLSQSAVSRQIVHLEAFLGRKLFVRQQRQLTLTRAGETYALQVRSILDDCVQATAEVMKSTGENELTIACTAGVAQFWMAPKLAQFRREHPDVNLRLVVRDGVSLLSAFEFDIALYYLKTPTLSSYETAQLIPEQVFPVCAPGYLDACRDRHGIAGDARLEPAHLLAETLLALEDAQSLWVSWRDWFRYHDLTLTGGASTVVFNNYPALVEMAVQEQGIVLGWRHVIDSQVERGRLVWASDHWAAHGGGYYLITPEERHENAATRRFKRWLLERAPGS
ncbi:LysR substrate-binding domain-containing protein [Salinicola rhizosphaerae]|uniref:LysR family transcriptional regulator n=1 Tax=Salinicola rhizosphaerae TaxID=1443141 RepID=A0ABQ3DXC1_9GAMM|nr:LysR substrate-binding domain-containing protein [Salinicola rhizosphaerae]GHB18567.1 LysR family transcriptional regulator [Salinicola rhizosphaerae]